MTPLPAFDPFAALCDDELVSSPTVVPPEPSREVPMTDSPSHHDDWYQSEDALSADRVAPPVPQLLAPQLVGPQLVGPGPAGGPTLTPGTDPSLGLRGLLSSLVPTAEPSLGFGPPEVEVAQVEGAPGETVPGDTAPMGANAARALALVAAVPIERVAPLMAVAFVCSVLVWALVQLLF